MIQKLLLFSVSLFTTLIQNKFSSTAKWFCLSFLMFQIGYGQTGCNVVKGGDFPTQTSLTSNWTTSTSTGTGWYVYGAEAYVDTDGATASLSQTVTGLFGDELTISFKIKGQNADRLRCGTSATLDVVIGGVTYMRITNPLNNATILETDIALLNGATELTTTSFPITVGGPGSGTSPGAPPGGKPGIGEGDLGQGTITFKIPWVSKPTTAVLAFVAITSDNGTSTNPSYCTQTRGGDDWLLDDIKLTADDPNDYMMNSSNGCAGTNTAMVLSNSQTGVSYQLKRNGTTNVGTAVAGTGGSISFVPQSTAGTYTVVAIVGTTECKVMSGSVVINPAPTLTGVSTARACDGSGALISLAGLLAGSTSTISYTIDGGSTQTATGVVANTSGAGSFISVPLFALTNNNDVLRITAVTNTSVTPNCTTTFTNRSVTLSVSGAATLADAGPDQEKCNTSTFTLAGNIVVLGTGVWSVVSGTATITTPSSRTSGVTGVPVGSSATLRWTITNGSCTTRDDVVLTNYAPATTSNAGLDISNCNSASFTLAGNSPTIGTGLWSVVSGTATITTPSLNTSGVTGITAGNSATLRWTITNGTCTSTDDVVLTNYATATVANAGADQTNSATCGLTSVTLNGNTATVGTGAWSIVSGTGGTITSPSTRNSTFSGAAGSTYTLRWTITNGVCSSADDVVITFNQSPTVSNAGPDQTGVSTCGLTSVTLAGNTPTVGTGVWSIVNGTGGTIASTSNPTSTFTGTAGSTYTLRWTISNSPCTASTDDVVITFNRNPTTSNAGSDQTGNATCGSTSVTLAGNTPSVGTGAWSIVSGTGGTITTPSSPTSTFTGTAGSTYTLRWTISNSPCTASTDDVVITFSHNPTIAVISSPAALCSGSSLNPILPTVTNNGSAVTASGWEISTASGGNTYTALSLPYTVAYADNGKNIRYYATNGCGRTDSNVVAITVNPLPGTPTVTAGTDPTCSSFLANWTAATNATGYYLDVSTVNDFSTGPYSNLDIGLVSSYNVTGLNKETTYFYRLRAYNGCGTSVSSAHAQIKTLDVAKATISGATTVCKDAASPAITFTNSEDGPITVTYNINSGSNLTINVGAKTTATVSVPTGTPGTFTYRLVSAVYQSVTTCLTSLTGSAIVTVNDYLTTPTVGTIANISCTTNTGSVVLNDLPSTGNWSITSTPVTVTTTGSGNTTTISGLASGSYTFTVTNASGCPSPASALVTISDFSSTTWNGSGWSHGLPDATKNLIIASSSGAPFASDLAGCALTVNNGIAASVPSGVTLTITNAVTVSGSGSLTFENTASLVQINNISNSGAIVYKRNSAPMKNFDFTYWASPVAGQTLYNLSPNTLWDKYFSFSGTAWVQITNGAGTMQPGIGYIIRVPKPNSTYTNGKDYWTTSNYVQPVEFIGVPNNGNITSSQTMVAGNLYLIGNPYPCAMDADEFLYTNLHNRAILEGTIYFWTHNTAITPTGTQYKYTSDDYASYNLTGGTGTSAGSAGNKTIPDGYIAAGQSFFATAKGAGNVEFNNSMRAGAYNNTFFKPGKTSKSTKLEKHRLWLNMINAGGAYKQALIGYVEGATNSFDLSFDGLSFDGNSYIDFYSVNAADNYVIQGRALPFTDTDLVPLGYRSTVAGDFTIAIDHADGNLATQRVYLEDKQTGMLNELTAGNYTFNTKAGTFNDRFVLKYTNRTLGTGDFESVDNSVSVLVQNKTITINSAKDNLEKVVIYDLAGKQLYSKDNINNLQLIMQNLPFAQQVLLVKIVLDNGTVTTKKIVFK